MIALESFAKIASFLFLPFFILGWYLSIPNWYTIGNDYQVNPEPQQLVLMFSISKHSFPLFVPKISGGQSLSALTLGQLYHPMVWISYLFPGYWSGYALFIQTCLRFLSLGGAQLFLYTLFSRLTTNFYWAFICSFLAVYNMRMLDCFRYGPSLESYTGFLFTSVSLAYLWLEPNKRRYLVLLALSTYWTICGGHTQMAYYAMLGVMLFTGLWPFICNAMLGQTRPAKASLLHYYIKSIGGMTVGLVLSAAYLIPLYFDFILSNAARMKQQSDDFSLDYTDNIVGAFNSFFFPLNGNVHGNFGGSALITIALFLPLINFKQSPYRKLLYLLWGVGAVVFLFLLGRATPVHHLICQIMPFFHAIRVPGRLSLLLPMMIAVILLLAQQQWSEYHQTDKNRTRLFYVILGIGAVYGLYSITINHLGPFTSYTPMRIRNISTNFIVYSQLLGTSSLIALAAQIRWPSVRILGYFVCLSIVVQTMITLCFGTWLTSAHFTRTLNSFEAQSRKGMDFDYVETMGMGTEEVDSYTHEMNKLHFPTSELAPYQKLATVHTNFEFIKDRADFFKRIETGAFHKNAPMIETVPEFRTRWKDTSNMTSNINQDDPIALHSLLPEIMKHSNTPSSAIRLTYSSYNRLEFYIDAQSKAYVVINYPFSAHWQAWVNHTPAATYRANGLYLAVPVPPGNSILEVRYEDTPQLIGMAISCIALASFGMVLLFYWLGTPKYYVPSVLVIGAVALFFWIWQNSLYTGDNMGTQYEYSSYDQ